MKKPVKALLVALLLLFVTGATVYCWFPGLIFEALIHVQRWRSGLERHEIQVDDHQLVYLEGGKGETILFVHGFGTDKDSWATFLPAFSGSYRLIVPDLPGFGETSGPDTAGYDIPSQVKRFARFIDTAGLDSFHLIGVSMGGYISAYYASEYPEKVQSLTLIDTAGVTSRIPSHIWQRYKTDGEILLLYRTPEQFDRFLSALFHHPPFIPLRFKEYFAERGARNYDYHKKILNQMVDGGMNLLESRLPRIRARTLLIWGKDDRIIHVSSVEKFKKGIKDCRTVIMDNCGHVPYLECPEKSKQAYREFLGSSHFDTATGR